MMMYGVRGWIAGDFSMVVRVPFTGKTSHSNPRMKALATYPTLFTPNSRANRKIGSHTTRASTSRMRNGIVNIQSMMRRTARNCSRYGSPCRRPPQLFGW